MKMENKIKENQRKMEYLKDNFGDTYFILLGDIIEKGHEIQEAIDMCWEMLVENDDSGFK